MNIFLTLDYELFFGLNSGTQNKSIIEPTSKLLKVLNKYNIKASFFIDSGYLIKLYEYKDKFQELSHDYDNIINQIKNLSKNGHDIQLHIHPHWEDSYYDGSKWIINSNRYRLHDFNNDMIEEIIFKYKKVLIDIVGDKVFAFRAGGWCIQPFSKIKEALKKNNIWLDSTVFENGYNKSKSHYFDFKKTPKKTFWNFDNNPLIEKKDSFFSEVPISSHLVSPLFFLKLIYFKKFGGIKYKSFGDGRAITGSKFDKLRMLIKYTNSVVSIDGYKASFLSTAYQKFIKEKDNNNFVVIGHPKAMSLYSLEMLEQFILNNKDKNFTTYSKEFNNEK